jgi:outer membrane biosynthesis protein TonB
MQSYRSQQALAGFFRNPTILAMIGSAGIHGVIVLFTGLNPAESLPAAPLRVISLDPGSDTTDLNGLLPSNGLPVPNGLPPINIGDVPTYLGSDPSKIDFGNLFGRNPPQKSDAGAQGPVIGRNLPKNPKKLSTDPTKSPSSEDNRSLLEKLQEQQNRVNYATNPNQVPPNLKQGTVQPLFPDPTPDASPAPSASPTLASPTGDSAAPARKKFNDWLEAKSQAYKQPVSTQSGPTLTAEYPQSACNTKVGGAASIAAIFGPDGSIAPGSDSIQVIQSAETLALTRAAVSTVERYRVPVPSGIYQSLNFKVDIPYSEAACATQSSPKAPIQTSPSPTEPIEKVIPKPSSTASPSARKPTSKEEFLRQLELGNQPIGTPPAPSPSSSQRQPTPSIAGTQSPEPLPAPSIVVPEGALKSP